MTNVVAERREVKIGEIVQSAWKLARVHGIAGLSLHALAREVGMRQPSLYGYFDSKDALYDAMFADGNRKMLEKFESIKFPRDARAALKRWLSMFTELAMEDPARYELLYQRHLPSFTPSATSYSLAEDVLAGLLKLMENAGVSQQGDIDCIMAVTAGLTEAQLSNDPGGTRWIRHLNRLIELLVDEATERSHK
jgi:AcrR family transcriptional regulator